MKALLIVDVQNDFLPGGALAVPGGDEILPVINALQEEYPLIVASKDWHPPDHVSFAQSHGKAPGETIVVEGIEEQQLWPIHCLQEDLGADFPPGLDTEKIAAVFYKGSDRGIDSYSAFFDNARKRSTGLHEYLQERGVDTLLVVGLATDYCVKATVLDALELGYTTEVRPDACRAIGDEQESLKEMEKRGARIRKRKPEGV